jgi:hypothetical protein
MEKPKKSSQWFILELYQYSNTPTLQSSKHKPPFSTEDPHIESTISYGVDLCMIF